MALKDDLYQVFIDMNDPDSLDVTGNEYLARECASIIKDYVAARTLTVIPSPVSGTDSGPQGTFTGNATVSWAISGSSIQSILISSMTQQMTDNDFAQAWGDALDADAPLWTASLSGQTVVPGSPPVTTPSSDSATISSTFQSAPVVTQLKRAFNDMRGMTSADQDPNDTFATALASAIETYYTSSINQGAGASHLSGCQFTVQVS